MARANINDFITSFKTDLARPCNFEVELIPPQSMLRRLSNTDAAADSPTWVTSLAEKVKNLSPLRCEKAEIPPRAFVLVEQKTYGPVEYYPIQNYYNKIPLTFICSGDMSERYFFDYWMELISSSYPSSTYYSSESVRFDFEYKNNYQIDIRIKQFGVDIKDVKYSAILVGAFPVEVYSLPLSWAQKDDYHKLDVVFAYRYFYLE